MIDYSGGGEEREARSPVQVVDLTSKEDVKPKPSFSPESRLYNPVFPFCR